MQTLALDKLLPEYQFSEKHRTQINAPSERVMKEVKQATPGEMPLVRLLFAVRSLPAILAGREGLATGKTDPLYEQMLAFGFIILAEEPDREVVVGLVGQMFKLRGDTPTVRDVREFAAFEAPGYAKAAMNFAVRPVDSRTELTTETRGFDHRSGCETAVRTLLEGDPTWQRGDPAQLAWGGETPGRARSENSRTWTRRMG